MYLSRMIPSLLILLAASPVFAQSSSPSPVDIAVPHITQDEDHWCWLAAAEMIITQRLSSSDSQCELIEDWESHPDGYCCEDYTRCDRTAIGLQEIAFLLEQEHGIHSRYGMPILQNALYNLLMSDMPVIAQVRYENGTHAVVIRGMQYRGRTAVLTVNDPARDAPYEISYTDFSVNWLDALVITH